MRVVLDTNILISACWKPDGLEARLVSMVLAGELAGYVSPAVTVEYHDVLLRPKFANLRERAQTLLAELDHVVHRVEPSDIAQASIDEDDNRFLECASEAKADYLITGNLRHYPSSFNGTRIVNARGFFTSER